MPRVAVIRCGQPCKNGKPCRKVVAVAGNACYTHKDVCPCCFEVPLKLEESVTPCGHRFHWKCLAEWGAAQQAIVKTCPSCRAPLQDEFQWPKFIMTDNLTWIVNNKKHANTYIKFIETSGLSISADMFLKQFEAITSIMMDNPIIPEGYILTTRNTADESGTMIPTMYFTYYMDFAMGKTKIPITIPLIMLPDFSLWDEFVAIKTKLAAIV